MTKASPVRANAPVDGLSRPRAAVAADLNAIVSVHQTAFNGFFLDRMGPRFLHGYYQAVLDYPKAILLVHENEAGEINGFASGFIDPEGFYAHFRAQRVRLLPTIVFALIKNPTLVVEILRNMQRVSAPQIQSEDCSELSSIATSARATGVGSILLRAFCDQSTHSGARIVRLTTDRERNEHVVAFYLKHDFKISGEELRGKRALNVMTRSL